MNIAKIMQQAQAMQQKMMEIQGKLSEMEVTGQAGSGMVTVRATCKGEIRDITIDPSLLNPTDKETLEDLVRAAINNTRMISDQQVGTETKRMMDELGLPADFKLPGM